MALSLALCRLAVLAWFLATSALSAGPTKIYINTIPAYSLLETCAELAVSTIVRDMSNGCGDDSQYTSYACFCYESSAKFSSMIGAHVSSACNPKFPQQNSSAIEVFSSYCKQGAVAPTGSGIVTVTSVDSSTSTPLPGTGPTSSSAQSTASPSPTSIPAPQPKKKTNVAAIAAGVTVPVVLIALGLAGVLFWRRKKTNEGPVELAAVEGRDPTSPEVYELKNKMVAVEIEGDTRRAELAPAAQSYELGQGTTGQGMTHELDSVPREKGAL